MFSPDGRWLAYVSDESGRDKVYVQPYAASGEKQLISPEGGTEPQWSPDGRELFFRQGRQMMSVQVKQTEATLTAGRPQLLFEGPYVMGNAGEVNYDISPEGQRFLMIKETEPAPAQINVVLNWFEELKRLVPTP